MIREKIARRIRSDGPLRLDHFIAMALFDPHGGYYASGRAGLGKRGDYFTNPCVGPTFGRLLASQFAEAWDVLGRPEAFDLVEQGADDGTLAADILGALEHHCPDAFARTRLTLVEPFPALRERQRAALGAWGSRVGWVDSLEALEPVTGVHYSNEYPDAIPVRRFERDGDGWLEHFVGGDESGFELVRLPPDAPDPTVRLPDGLPEPYLAEVRPEAEAWIASVASRIERGFALVIDYGFPSDALYAPWRNAGTLACYRRHTRDGDPLLDPGEKDITAHVDFSALTDAAVAAGMVPAGFADQHHFLVAAAEPLLAEPDGAPDSPDRRKLLAELKTLLHPELMGTQFKYLCVSKGLPRDASLSGFRYARGARP